MALASTAGETLVSFRRGKRPSGEGHRGARSTGVSTEGVASVLTGAVGVEPGGDILLGFFFVGNPVEGFLLEVHLAIVGSDVRDGSKDSVTGVLHFAGELGEVAVSVVPAIGDAHDEYFVEHGIVRIVLSQVRSDHVQAGVGTWGAVEGDESQGFGDYRVHIDVDLLVGRRPQGGGAEPGGQLANGGPAGDAGAADGVVTSNGGVRHVVDELEEAD